MIGSVSLKSVVAIVAMVPCPVPPLMPFVIISIGVTTRRVYSD